MRVQRELAAQSAIAALTRVLPFMDDDDISLPVSFIARLLQSEKTLARLFATQYISGGGLAAGLLDRYAPPSPPPLLTTASL